MSSRTLAFAVVLALATAPLAGQQPAPKPLPVERVGPNLLRLGEITVDTAKRELSVRGHINDVTTLEWVANTRDGMKAYESAMTVEADAVTFNAALLLIGLDPAHARVPTQHFDRVPPAGDPVEMLFEFSLNGQPVRMNVERLMWDREKLAEVPFGAWVYTGSTFNAEGRYHAELDGVLIGFVHSPAPTIEQVGGVALGRFGWIVLNQNLGLTPKMPVTLFVRNITPRK
jgi:hypothetical protein